MARVPKSQGNPVKALTQNSGGTDDAGQKPARPLIFISHDHRDAALAEAFSNLLTDASGGFLKSFRSSDRKGTTGIEFGAEWYSEIMGKINVATDVLALLTANSVDRPWILYEAGVAKGKLDKPVFGLVVGVALDQATRGPFAQFQNCADDEDSLTKLVLQLIKRNSDAEPREEAVRLQVRVFRSDISTLLATEPVASAKPPSNVEASSVAMLFEEVKVMFRDLPDRLQGQMEGIGPRGRRRRRFHPMMMMEMIHHPAFQEDTGGRAIGWLMIISTLKDDAPWLYELGLDIYHALQADDERGLESAVERFERTLSVIGRGPMAEMVVDGPEMDMAVHELGHMAHKLLRGPRPQRQKGKKPAEG